MTITPKEIYETLLAHFQPQHWWPVDLEYHIKHQTDPRYEIILGAILTQNTQWSNVEKALHNLKNNHLLSIQHIQNLPLETIKHHIHPSGFYNQKAQRVQTITTYLSNKYQSNLDNFFSQKTIKIRSELLGINGIGPETADSILLYAGNHPIFVIDAYTRRISKRLKLPTNYDSYVILQSYYTENLSNNYLQQKLSGVYKETHALLVELAKRNCTKKPTCSNCPLHTHCSYHQSVK